MLKPGDKIYGVEKDYSDEFKIVEAVVAKVGEKTITIKAVGERNYLGSAFRYKSRWPKNTEFSLTPLKACQDYAIELLVRQVEAGDRHTEAQDTVKAFAKFAEKIK